MKNKRALLMMTVAVLLGLLAVVIASTWLLRQPGAAATRIVLAGQDINLGQRLTPDMLKLAEWPKDNLPAGVYTDPAKLNGRVAKTSVLKGEPISEVKLAPQGTLGGLSALITEGRRAITVRVNDVIGVAGFALPGNYVDIIVNTRREQADDGKEQSISKIVLERILVLAVAQEVSRDETTPKVVNAVTLEVTPTQAEAIDLARSVGTLSLVLRNQIDPQPAATGGATKGTLLADALPQGQVAPSTPPAGKAAPPQRARTDAGAARRVAQGRGTCVTVLRGMRETKECFK